MSSLQILLLGSPKTILDNELVNWHHKNQAEVIFYYLVTNRGKAVPEKDLLEIVWGTTFGDQSYKYYESQKRDLGSIISHMRRIIEPKRKRHSTDEEASRIEKVSGALLFRKQDDTFVDIEEFDASYNKGISLTQIGDLEKAIPVFENLVKIYRGHFLGNFVEKIRGNRTWAETKQDTLRYRLIDVLSILTISADTPNKRSNVIELCNNVLGFDPTEPAIFALVALLYHLQSETNLTEKARMQFINLSKKYPHKAPEYLLENLKFLQLSDKPNLLPPIKALESLLFEHRFPENQLQNPFIKSQVVFPVEIPNHPFFTGRDGYIKAISDELISGKRLIEITSLPGFGSSAFAAQVVSRIISIFPGGVYWFDADKSENLELELTEKLGRVLCTPLEQGAIIKGLQNKGKALLVFDNIKTSRIQEDVLNFIISAGNLIKAIFVSSTDMELNGFAVKKLPLGPLSAEEGRDLFLKILRNIGINEQSISIETVSRICDELGGYPPAIIGSAQQALYFPLPKILSDIKLSIPNVPSQSLARITENLPDDIVQMLMDISFFPHGLSIHSIDALSSAQKGLYAVSEILKRNLVIFDGTRYFMPRIVRQFIHEYYDTAILTESRNRVVNHIVEFSTKYRDSTDLISERATIFSLMEEVEAKQDWGTFLKLSHNAERLLDNMGLVNERVRLLEKCIQISRKDNNLFEEARYLNLTAKIIGAEVFGFDSERSLALDYCQRALNIQTQLDNTLGIASNLGLMALLHYRNGDYDLALHFCNQSLVKWHQLTPPDERGEVGTLLQLGKVHLRMGNEEEALRIFTECSRIENRYFENPTDWAMFQTYISVMGSLGDLYYQMGNNSQSRTYFSRILHLGRQKNYASGIVRGLIGMAQIYQTEARFEDAIGFLNEAISICENIKDYGGISVALNIKGNILDSQGEIEKAEEIYRKALIIKEQIGDKFGAAWSKLGIALCLMKLGDKKRADRLLESVETEFHLPPDSRISKTICRIRASGVNVNDKDENPVIS